MPYFFLASAALVWGGSYAAGKALVTVADPLVIAWARHLIASAAFLILQGLGKRASKNGSSQPGSGQPGSGRKRGEAGLGRSQAGGKGRRPAWYVYPLLGLTGTVAYNGFVLYALTLTSATEASLIAALSPVINIAFGFLFLGERVSAPKLVGALVSIVGVGLVILGAPVAAGTEQNDGGMVVDTAATEQSGRAGISGRLLGDLLVLASGASWAAYSVIGRKVLGQVSAIDASARGIYWGTLIFTALVLWRHGLAALGLIQARDLPAILYLSLAGTVYGFIAWYKGLARVEVSRAAVFSNIIPFSTAIIAAATLGERPAWLQLLGGLVILGGAYATNAAGLKAGLPKAA